MSAINRYLIAVVVLTSTVACNPLDFRERDKKIVLRDYASTISTDPTEFVIAEPLPVWGPSTGVCITVGVGPGMTKEDVDAAFIEFAGSTDLKSNMFDAYAETPDGRRHELVRNARGSRTPTNSNKGSEVFLCRYFSDCSKEVPNQVSSVTVTAIEPFSALSVEWHTSRPLN